MLVYVWKGEAYPIYGVDCDPTGGTRVIVPDELLERFKKAEKEYNAVQDELGKYSCE